MKWSSLCTCEHLHTVYEEHCKRKFSRMNICIILFDISSILWSHYFRSALSLISKQPVQRENPYLQAGLRALTKGKAESDSFTTQEKELLVFYCLPASSKSLSFPLQTESRKGSSHFTARITKSKKKHIVQLSLFVSNGFTFASPLRAPGSICVQLKRCAAASLDLFPRLLLRSGYLGKEQDWKAREGLEWSCSEPSCGPDPLHIMGKGKTYTSHCWRGEKQHSRSCSKREKNR